MIGEKRLCETLVQGVKSSESDLAELCYMGGKSLVTRFSHSAIHQSAAEQGGILFARVISDGKVGVATTSSLSAEAIRGVLARALDIAKVSETDEHFAGLPGPGEVGEMPPGSVPSDRMVNWTPADTTREIGVIVEETKKAGFESSGSYSISLDEIAVANSLGLVRYCPSSLARLVLIVEGGEGTGYSSGDAADAASLDSRALAQEAGERCRLAQRPQGLEPGAYDVILGEYALVDLMEWLSYIGFGAVRFREGTSFMSDRLGEKIMGESVTIWDDGMDPACDPFPFDFEGTLRHPVMLIEKGVAEGVVHDRESAARANTTSTGHARPPTLKTEGPLPLHLHVAPGETTREEMLAALGEGIVVTRFHYVNGLLDTRRAVFTGMTRDGTYWVEDGKISHAIKNFRFNQSMLEAFSRVEMVSKEAHYHHSGYGRAGMVVPSMLIRGFNFTGSTEY